MNNISEIRNDIQSVVISHEIFFSIWPDQFNFLFHGLILPKYESVGRQKKKKKKYESH